MDKGKKAHPLFSFVILNRGGNYMGRPKGTKNIMRSPKEKEQIVLEAYEKGPNNTFKKYKISHRLLSTWMRKYRENGIDGLESRTGKNSKGYGRPIKPKNREQELELENLKLKVENARLKKGYQVKGVGSKKEYVTIKDLNTKS